MSQKNLTQTAKRRHELDWLRVLAFFILIVFHSMRAFMWNDPWHINNDETSIIFTAIGGWLHTWRLALLFMISGVGIWFSMGSRTIRQFLSHRFLRLAIPGLICTVLIVAPQVYVERLHSGDFSGSFLSFYPHFFNGFYPEGNFSPHHLWYVGWLWEFCLVGFPIFFFFKTKAGGKLLDGVARIVSKPWFLLPGMVLVFMPVSLILEPISNGFWFHWENRVTYFIIVLFGFFLASRPHLFDILHKQRRQYLTIAVIGYAVYEFMVWIPGIHFPGWAIGPVEIIAVVSWLMTILGYAQKFLRRKNGFIAYHNEAVYPIYILHQTITLILVYFLVPLPMHWFLKFVYVLGGTIIFTWGIYHLFIRPFNFVRPIFGMKLKPRNNREEAVSTEPAMAGK